MGTKMQERQFGASMSFAIAKSNDNHVKKVLEERMIPKDNVFSGQNFTLDGVPPHLTLAQIENEMRTTPLQNFPCRVGKELFSAWRISLRGFGQQSRPSTNSGLIFSSEFKGPALHQIGIQFFDFFIPY
jgi:hypothetical protein